MTDEVVILFCFFFLCPNIIFPFVSDSQTQWIWVPRMSWWIFQRWMKGFGQAAWGLTWHHRPSLLATMSPHWTWGPRPWRNVGSGRVAAKIRTRTQARWQQEGPPVKAQSCLTGDWHSLLASQCRRPELSQAWHALPAPSSPGLLSRSPAVWSRSPATTQARKQDAIHAACRRKGWGI